MKKVYGHGFFMIPVKKNTYIARCNKCDWESDEPKDYDGARSDGERHQEEMRA